MSKVGYIHSTCDCSRRVQERIISQFCEMQGINLANIFVDSDNDTGGKLTWLPSDNQPFYTEGKLLKSWIQEGKIDCIYVDSEIRLKVAYSHPDDFWKLCHDRDIRIIEIFLDDKISESKCLQRTVVYHFTDGSEKRPCMAGGKMCFIDDTKIIWKDVEKWAK